MSSGIKSLKIPEGRRRYC